MVKRIICLALVFCSDASAQSWYLGQWRVVDMVFAGITAMDINEAQNWVGRKATLRSEKAFFRTWQCEKPRYLEVDLTEAQFYSDYRVSFEMLDIQPDTVTILDIKCPFEISAKGAVLIQANHQFSYSLWDGVFFKMSKI
jgi:hypothetical protein